MLCHASQTKNSNLRLEVLIPLYRMRYRNGPVVFLEKRPTSAVDPNPLIPPIPSCGRLAQKKNTLAASVTRTLKKPHARRQQEGKTTT